MLDAFGPNESATETKTSPACRGERCNVKMCFSECYFYSVGQMFFEW